MEGHLLMRSRYLKRWEDWRFVLKEDTLYYFKPDKKDLKHLISVKNSSISRHQDEKRIIIQSSGKTYQIKAFHAIVAEAWYTSLINAQNSFHKPTQEPTQKPTQKPAQEPTQELAENNEKEQGNSFQELEELETSPPSPKRIQIYLNTEPDEFPTKNFNAYSKPTTQQGIFSFFFLGILFALVVAYNLVIRVVKLKFTN